jgi:hypothetical protein
MIDDSKIFERPHNGFSGGPLERFRYMQVELPNTNQRFEVKIIVRHDFDLITSDCYDSLLDSIYKSLEFFSESVKKVFGSDFLITDTPYEFQPTLSGGKQGMIHVKGIDYAKRNEKL